MSQNPAVRVAWTLFYAGLAVLVGLSHWPRFLEWMFEPSSRIIGFRYYSPLIELTVCVYLACALAFWKGWQWAPWLASAWVLVSATSRSFLFMLPVGGMDTSSPGLAMSTLDLVRNGPAAWPEASLSILWRAVLIGLLLGPSLGNAALLRDARFLGGVRVADQIAIRLIGIAQLLACLLVFVFPYGIGFHPPLLAFNLAGVAGAILLLIGRVEGRIVLIGWYLLWLVVIVSNAGTRAYPAEVAIAWCAALVSLLYLALSLWAARRRG